VQFEQPCPVQSPQGLARRMGSHGEVIRRDLKRLRHGRRGLAFEIDTPKLFG